MSSIDIYRVLRKIPNVSDDEAKQAAEFMASGGQATTEADLGAFQAITKADLIAQEARREVEMIKLAIWAVVVTVTLTVSLTVSLVKLF